MSSMIRDARKAQAHYNRLQSMAMELVEQRRKPRGFWASRWFWLRMMWFKRAA